MQLEKLYVLLLFFSLAVQHPRGFTRIGITKVCLEFTHILIIHGD